MNNSSLLTADGMTHLKIVVVALIASIAVVVVGITARTVPETARIAVIKVDKPTTVTLHRDTVIR